MRKLPAFIPGELILSGANAQPVSGGSSSQDIKLKPDQNWIAQMLAIIRAQ
ncbi:hypothetical protein [Pseudobacter ginsenosidimutans]|uniref:Uncharacterized protein n=1 Tax=Pseudobacter ginsenosidimutans TaxID=661488 RepID=A0A4Q7MDS1_9BACT|nr:hypothetical protein [Pseudobacter ginsenosidimutans]RZS65523.1 hypothetical protein EV199_5697 [Pseudobacter ginsenosidimutans]